MAEKWELGIRVKRMSKEGKGRKEKLGLLGNGVVLMGGAALLSKLLGAFQKIPLQNLAGDRVFGIYNAVYPFYQLVMVLAAAGLPTAVSIVIARRLEEADGEAAARSTLSAALLLLGVTGALSFIVMWLSADWTAEWIGDGSAASSIRALSLALLAAPAAAALRGFRQGSRQMGVSASSQLAEQLVRVAVMVLALGIGLRAGWSDAKLAASVMSGSAFGAAAAACLLLTAGRGVSGGKKSKKVGTVISLPEMEKLENKPILSKKERESKARTARLIGGSARGTAGSACDLRAGRSSGGQAESTAEEPLLEDGKGGPLRRTLGTELKELSTLALPAALAAIVVPAVGVVDAFTMPRMLTGSGYAAAAHEAMSLFGVYNRAQPLVQLLVMVAGAAAAALVPGLVKAKLANDDEQLRLRLSLLARLTWMIGAAAALGLVLLARPINMLLYKDAQGTATFALMGCTALAGCVSAAVAPALQALGSARVPIALLLLAALLKGALNAALVPALGIEGGALSGVVALSAAALLGAAALRHAAAKLRPPPHARVQRRAVRAAAGTALALACMAAALLLTERALTAALGDALPPRAAAAVLALTGVAVGACVFAAAAVRSGVIPARDMRALPGGEGVAARLMRLRLLPREQPPRD